MDSQRKGEKSAGRKPKYYRRTKEEVATGKRSGYYSKAVKVKQEAHRAGVLTNGRGSRTGSQKNTTTVRFGRPALKDHPPLNDMLTIRIPLRTHAPVVILLQLRDALREI